MIPKLLTALAVSTALLTGSVSMVAAQEAYNQRSEAMKAVGNMAKTIGDMLRGNTDFDAGKANEVMVAANDAVADFATYFPEGSDGGESEAAPAIWEDADGFAAAVTKFQDDLGAAIASNPQSQEEVQAAFGSVAQNCKACHENYRIQK